MSGYLMKEPSIIIGPDSKKLVLWCSPERKEWTYEIEIRLVDRFWDLVEVVAICRGKTQDQALGRAKSVLTALSESL